MKKIAKSWRLDSVSAARLEELSKCTKTSQTTIIEELISACHRELCDDFKGENEKAFPRFCEAMRYRLEIAREGEE
jgi:predicted DNA-binding protein